MALEFVYKTFTVTDYEIFLYFLLAQEVKLKITAVSNLLIFLVVFCLQQSFVLVVMN